MSIMRRVLTAAGLVGLFVGLFAVTITGCESNSGGLFSDVIEGKWQLVSVNGDEPTFVTEVEFTEDSYTGSTAGVETNSGAWTKSGDTYTFTGEFFGFADSGSFTPTFSNSNNTMTYTNESEDTYIYNRK